MITPDEIAFVDLDPKLLIGTAIDGVRRRPRRPSRCACGLPRSEYEGHNCPANGWRWTRWPS